MDIPDLLKGGPKTTKELAEALVPASMTEKTLHKRLRDMVEEGRVLKLPYPSEGSWTSLYSLPQDEKKAITMCGYIPTRGKDAYVGAKIEAAFQRLEGRLLRHPTPDEVLLDAGESPEDKTARDLLYRIGAQRHWRPPTEEEIREAKTEQQWTIKLALRLKHGATEESLAEVATPEEAKRAREYLERFPEWVR